MERQQKSKQKSSKHCNWSTVSSTRLRSISYNWRKSKAFMILWQMILNGIRREREREREREKGHRMIHCGWRERARRWPEKKGRYSVGLVPRVPSDVSSRRNACTSDVRRPMYIIYEVSAFPTMINQAATRQEPRAFEALRRGEKPCPVQTLRAFFFRNPSLLLLFLPPFGANRAVAREKVWRWTVVSAIWVGSSLDDSTSSDTRWKYARCV